jgi:hypothetical protein
VFSIAVWLFWQVVVVRHPRLPYRETRRGTVFKAAADKGRQNHNEQFVRSVAGDAEVRLPAELRAARIGLPCGLSGRFSMGLCHLATTSKKVLDVLCLVHTGRGVQSIDRSAGNRLVAFLSNFATALRRAGVDTDFSRQNNRQRTRIVSIRKQAPPTKKVE